MIAGLVLAAGASRRLGTPKQLLLDTTGTPLVARAAQQLLAAECTPVLVVTGAAADAVAEAVAGVSVTCVHHAGWAEGMGSTIRCGIDVLMADASVDAVCIVACDMPSVTTAHVRALCARGAARARVASTYSGPDGQTVRGIPACFPRADFAALAALSGDRGARALLAAPETRLIPLPDGSFDLDTPADVARWRPSSS